MKGIKEKVQGQSSSNVFELFWHGHFLSKVKERDVVHLYPDCYNLKPVGSKEERLLTLPICKTCSMASEALVISCLRSGDLVHSVDSASSKSLLSLYAQLGGTVALLVGILVKLASTLGTG